jgi:hypothetical protein
MQQVASLSVALPDIQENSKSLLRKCMQKMITRKILSVPVTTDRLLVSRDFKHQYELADFGSEVFCRKSSIALSPTKWCSATCNLRQATRNRTVSMLHNDPPSTSPNNRFISFRSVLCIRCISNGKLCHIHLHN